MPIKVYIAIVLIGLTPLESIGNDDDLVKNTNRDSIVKIEVLGSLNQMRKSRKRVTSTGFFIKGEGKIMTVRHGLDLYFRDPDSKIKITNYLGESAKTVSFLSCEKSSSRDICILKVSGFEMGQPLRLEQPLFVDESQKKVFDTKIYGFCEDHSLYRKTKILKVQKFKYFSDSKAKRKLAKDFSGFTRSHFVEFSARVCKRDSGGPLIDRKGRVVGMVVSSTAGRNWALSGKDLILFESRIGQDKPIPSNRIIYKQMSEKDKRYLKFITTGKLLRPKKKR